MDKETISRLRQYISKASFSHAADRHAANQLLDMLADPVPPAGVDGFDLALKIREALDRKACPDAWMRIAVEASRPLFDELISNVTRLQAEVRQLRQHKNDYMEAAEETRKALQAEVETLQALSVTNILLDVTPGEDGMGHEVYAKSVLEVEEALGRMGLEVEELESRIEAIDTVHQVELEGLRAKVETLDVANKEWLDKTDWLTKTVQGRELGKHRADVMLERISLLQADLIRARELLNLADHYLEENSFNNVGEVVEHTQEMREAFRRTIQAYLTGS